LAAAALAKVSDIDTLAVKLKRLAKERPSLDVAQFRFIGLEPIQEALGESWPAHKAKISDSAHSFIVNRLGGDDLLIRGGDGFLVVFGSLNEREAEIEALQLTHALNEFFVGIELPASAPRVSVDTRSVDVADLVRTLREADYVEPAPRTVAAPDPSTLDWKFEPEWDVRGEAILGYGVAPVDRASGERLAGYRFDPLHGRMPSMAAIDEQAFRMAEAAARQLAKDDKRARLTVPVHVTTLSNGPSRKALLDAIGECDRDLLRLRVLRISGVTPGFPRLYLEEMITQVRRKMPYVSVAAAWNEPDFASLLQVDPTSVGFIVPKQAFGSGPSAPQPALLARARQAHGWAQAAKRPFFVEGALSRELAMRLSAIGVDQLSSPAIWPMVDAPQAAMRWTADRLIAG
jgi:hypothetical protein